MSKFPTLAWFLLLLSPSLGQGQEPTRPPPLPANAPKLDRDVIIMTVGSSITMNRPYREEIPAWTGGYDRVPPQTNGQNVFFRVFEMLNDHENMCWRRLTDKDWTRKGTWAPESQLPYNDACYGKRVSYIASDPDDFAELAVPQGYEKIDLIYTTDPKGEAIRVLIDGQAPAQHALVDSFQETRLPKDVELSPELDTFDSHGLPIKLKRPSQGTKNLVELRSRYRVDPTRPHVFRVERGSSDPGKRILIWGAVYWRGNCAQVVQRAKGGLNCGDLPNYLAIQEVVSMQPDYLLMEAINIRENADQVQESLSPGFGWCAQRNKSMKTLVYMTSQANSKAFRETYKKKLTDETADACAAAVVELCKTYKFPVVDVGPAADQWLVANPQAQFIPHIQMDWFHPNQWGAAVFGETIGTGIRTHWPELPVRSLRPLHFPMKQAREAAPEKGPLVALPSKGGPHLEKIKALKDGDWVNLGKPAPDPKWGLARGRSWTPNMPAAPDLGGAFLYGEGVHGYVKPDGYYMDDLWFYDVNAHTWICAWPGTDTRNVGAFKLNADGFVVTPSGQCPPIASLVHGYNMPCYSPELKKFVGIPGRSYQCKEITEMLNRLLPDKAAKDNYYSQGQLFFYDVPTGRWERPKVMNAPQAVFGYGATLAWLPTKKVFSVYRLEDDFHNFDYAAKTWTVNKPAGKSPNCRDYEGLSCYDSKRNRLMVFNRRGSQPQGKFGILDVEANRWIECSNANNPEQSSGGGYDSHDGCAHYDAANDVVIVWLDRKTKPGAYVYDIAKDQWTKEPVALGKRKGVTSFYCPEVNAHIYFDAGDSNTEPGNIWAWRYKNPKK